MIKFNVTEENPLHRQLSNLDRNSIEEIAVKGFLCYDDYELLTEMSGANGSLKIIDLYEVDETDCWCTEHFGFESKHDHHVWIADDAFNNSSKLERIILPKQLYGIGSYAFIGCINLKGIDFPDTLNYIDPGSFVNCPNLGEIYIGDNLSLPMCDPCFAGSASSFICDWNQWPINKEEEPLYPGDGFGYFSHDGVLFFGFDWGELNGTGIDLEKYPSLHKRDTYHVPYHTVTVKVSAFRECKYLRKLVFPKSCGIFSQNSIRGCPVLETLVFKGRGVYGWSGHSMSSWSGGAIIDCPKLQDIYLYAEEPDYVDFDVFARLENIGNIVLHVPCFCASKYRQYKEEGNHIKCWQKFKRIEEFDPIDFIEEEK